MVSPSSTGPNLTEQGYNTTFRVAAREDSPAIALAASFRNRLDLDKVAIVEFEGSPAYAADGFANTFTGLGGTITSRRTVTSTVDFTAALTDIKDNDAPGAIFYVDGDAARAGEFSHISSDVVGMTDVLIGWDPLTDDAAVLAAYAAAAGAAADGDYATMHGLRTQDMAHYDEFNAVYQAAGFPNYGDEATIVAPYAYDAANIIINAIAFAQSTDPGDIRDAIAGTTSYSGVVGIYDGFDAKGDVIPQWSLLMRYANGQWSKLYPGQIFLPVIANSFAP
jgi:branched-chain amino acid transport system substrate-binding protein